VSHLSDLLNAVLPDGWSARRVSREAEAKGFRLSAASSTAYFGGRHGRPDEETLQALAAVLPVSIVKLRQAATLSPGITTPYKPPAVADRLTDRERSAVDEMIRLLADRKEGVGNAEYPAPTKDAPSNVTPLRGAKGPQPHKQAATRTKKNPPDRPTR
jgi:hypothetical protein